MSFRARTFKVEFQCYVDPEIYNGFNVAICLSGQLPTANPIQQLYIKPPYNPLGVYNYIFYDFFLDDTKTYDVFVQAIAFNTDSFWRSVGGIEIPDDGIGTIGDNSSNVPPQSVSSFTATITETGVLLQWSPVYNYNLSHFVIKPGTDWSTTEETYTGKNTAYMLPMLSSGSYSYMIKSVNTLDVESTTYASVSFNIVVPVAPELTATIVGENIRLEWNSPDSSFPIVEYDMKLDGVSIGRIKTTTHTLKAPTAGNHRYEVAAVNAVGQIGGYGIEDIVITAPGQVTIFPQVIDNNVLLRWGAPTVGSLPILYYEVRKGESYATSVQIGNIDSLFTAIFETTSGNYKYWVTAVDTSYNSGVNSFTSATVSQPPDYVLYSNYDSDFSGTKTNVFLTPDNTLLTPVVTNESWATHFTKQGITTPQQQIDLGYTMYAEPSLETATYQEEIDYGSNIGATKITITPSFITLHGSVSVSCSIDVWDSVNSEWDNLGSVFEVYATNFQKIRFTLTFTASSSFKNLIEVNNINITLSVKTKTDGGHASCLSTDVGGTSVNFNIPFFDVQSLGVTPQLGGTVAYGLYDFVDAPNPTSFKILLYDRNGNRVSGTASWTAKGV